MTNKGFTETQKQYLEGLVSGLRAGRRSTQPAAPQLGAQELGANDTVAESPPGPDQTLWEAQDRFILAGRRLAPEAVVSLDWHNDMSKLILDINDRMDMAADDRARAVIIRRLRRTLEADD